MKSQITVFRDFSSLRIYINGCLHFEIPMEDHNGMQSWLQGTKKKMYYIEFYRKNSESILMEYDDENIWKDILKLVDENI